MPTPHNNASLGEIADTVLLPGDPLRAKYLAEHYLDHVREITGARNMLGFTGEYQNRRITVMGSGMGAPSCGIYSYELFKVYGVERIIRIGTAGGLQPELAVGDLVFALTSSTDGAWAHQYHLPGTYSPACDYPLLEEAVHSAREHGFSFAVGGVFSSDLFSDYDASTETTGEPSWAPWARMGCLAQDMETYALYCNAAWLKKRALSILTHTDSCVLGEGLPDSERMTALTPMFTVALDVAVAE